MNCLSSNLYLKNRTQLGKLSDEVPQEKCQDKDSNFDYKDSNETEQQSNQNQN